MNIKESIDATKKGFEESFSIGEYYNRQTQDVSHLEQIMEFLPIRKGMRILDLGTGSGYLSFPIAKARRDCEIVGLDIVENALESNRERAQKEGISNLSFVSYDGIDFPFADASFDLVITRYALHHFPDIEHSIEEVARVLKKGGAFFISGHIKFYTKEEWEKLCGNAGMSMTDCFASSIRFPKKKDTAYGFSEVLQRHDPTIIKSYDLVETDTEIYVTEQVNNILFTLTD